MRNRVNHPRQHVAIASVVGAITDWEKDMQYLAKVSPGYCMDEQDRRLNLINMLPKDLGDYMLRETHRFPGYDDIKRELHEHIARARRPGGSAKLNLFNDPEQDEDEPSQQEDYDDDHLYEEELADNPPEEKEQILAIVRNVKMKAAKGKGKGKGKGEREAKAEARVVQEARLRKHLTRNAGSAVQRTTSRVTALRLTRR